MHLPEYPFRARYVTVNEFLSPSDPTEDNQPYVTIPCSESKITSAVWGPLGEFVIAGHENGEIAQFSAKVGTHTVCPDTSINCLFGPYCSQYNIWHLIELKGCKRKQVA